jgi:hypothetical protein
MGFLDWGLCPQTPGIYRFFPAGMAGFSKQFEGGIWLPPPAFPAAEPVARVAFQHCPIPSDSGNTSIAETSIGTRESEIV